MSKKNPKFNDIDFKNLIRGEKLYDDEEDGALFEWFVDVTENLRSVIGSVVKKAVEVWSEGLTESQAKEQYRDDLAGKVGGGKDYNFDTNKLVVEFVGGARFTLYGSEWASISSVSEKESQILESFEEDEIER